MLSLKWENLSYCSTKLIHFLKNYHLHWTAGRASILYTYFFNFGRDFYRPFSTLLPKTPASCGTNILK